MYKLFKIKEDSKNYLKVNKYKGNYKIPSTSLLDSKDIDIKEGYNLDKINTALKMIDIYDYHLVVESSFQYYKIYIYINNIRTITRLKNKKDLFLMIIKEDGATLEKDNLKGCYCLTIKKEITKTLYLKDIIKVKSKKTLNVNFGIDEKNNIVNVDISKLPHLLIAGTTGSGKSCFINSFIISIIYNYTPKDVKLCLVDTKQVEFKTFESIPHLMFKPCYNENGAIQLLDYLISIMRKRYETFKDVGFRDIEEHNKICYDSKMEYIILIIDELADLMLFNKKGIESRLCKLAQLSRACGIYIIVGTQRPDTSIITGLIKSNFPSRLSFKVASVYDSRVVLDNKGAENLLGNGDSILKLSNGSNFTRLQAPFISSESIKKVMRWLDERQNK